MAIANIEHLRRFVQDMTRAVEKLGEDEPAMLRDGRKLLAGLIARDDWLPEEFARPHPDGYRQYLLYCDPLERFSVVSFVWGTDRGSNLHLGRDFHARAASCLGEHGMGRRRVGESAKEKASDGTGVSVEPLPIRKAPGKIENNPQNDTSSENCQRGQISPIITKSG